MLHDKLQGSSHSPGDVGLAFGLVLAAGFSTAIGAATVFCTSFAKRSFLAGALGASAGVMLYVSAPKLLLKYILLILSIEGCYNLRHCHMLTYFPHATTARVRCCIVRCVITRKDFVCRYPLPRSFRPNRSQDLLKRVTPTTRQHVMVRTPSCKMPYPILRFDDGFMPAATFCFFGGMLFIWLLDKLVHAMTHLGSMFCKWWSKRKVRLVFEPGDTPVSAAR